jgi:molybdopterin converting factor small subunit
LKIRFYGQLGEKLGGEIDLAPPSGTATVADLRSLLAGMFPDTAAGLLQRSRACIADAIVGEDRALADAEVVEFFPPLSGG